jgi:hypothetical protein
MRVAVLILGILGSLGAITLAGIYYIAQSANDFVFRAATDRTPQQAITEGIDPELPLSWNLATAQEWLDGCHWQSMSIWFLLGAFVLGILGSILGFTRQGIAAGMVLLAAFAAPVVVYPSPMMALPSLLALAGILAFFIKSLPTPAPARNHDDE